MMLSVSMLANRVLTNAGNACNVYVEGFHDWDSFVRAHIGAAKPFRCVPFLYFCVTSTDIAPTQSNALLVNYSRVHSFYFSVQP